LKIDITSDLHLDFFLRSNKTLNENKIKVFVKQYFKESDSKTLIVAGDIGHYNIQNYEVLKYLREHYYENIVCVLGNHDYYLLSANQEKKYSKNSFKRVDEARGMYNSIDGVHCLNGNVIEIDGVKFGGCDSWYDGSYYNQLKMTQGKDIVDYWKQTMNDAKRIKGIEDFYDLFAIERKKLDLIYKDCDVMVTHVCPSINNDDLPLYKVNDKITGFYSFNGDEWLMNTNAKYWVYGHLHNGKDFERHGVKCLTSALGYPDQHPYYRVKTIEVL
jgi:predicted phosphodiesterase